MILTVVNPHAGRDDSSYHRSSWQLQQATLSAHWQTPTDETATYSYKKLGYADNYRGRPRVWVARDKHANYRSESVCDAGAAYTDTCDHNRDSGNLEVRQDRNIGNRWLPGGRGGTQLNYGTYSQYRDYGLYINYENFWFEPEFGGWLVGHPKAGGYTKSLEFFRF